MSSLELLQVTDVRTNNSSSLRGYEFYWKCADEIVRQSDTLVAMAVPVAIMTAAGNFACRGLGVQDYRWFAANFGDTGENGWDLVCLVVGPAGLELRVLKVGFFSRAHRAAPHAGDVLIL